ncbi:hypothetical protein LXA43DRAFT_1104990 [Ganoderma leucocontextum]|nr:hypothetical protein LXA43DRAFT_1104990 [Ganoderma leucocontextum]
MSAIITEADLRAIDRDIQASARDENANVLALLLPLGFSDAPSEWPTEAEPIINRLITAAIRSTVDRLQRVGHRFRVQRTSTLMVTWLADLTRQTADCELVLAELDAAVGSNFPHLDPRCYQVVQARLPEVYEGITSFRRAVSCLRALLGERMPVFSLLEQPAHALRGALQPLFDGPPETFLLYGVAIVETLVSMWNERQTIIAEASALISGLTSRPQDLHGVKHDLQTVARRLQYQVPQHQSYVNALTILVNSIDDELPVLRALEQEVTVRDLFNAPAEQRLLDAALLMISDHGDALERVLHLMISVLELGTDPVADD